MKRIAVLLIVMVALLLSTPVLAAGVSISPPSVEFDVPAAGSAEVEFLVYDFTGDLGISLEDIPLRVEPTTVPVTAKEKGTRVVLTFYGDRSLGSKIYQGKIRFLAMTGGTVAMGIKVKATVTNLVEGETPVLVTPELPPEETQAPPEEAAPPEKVEKIEEKVVVPSKGISTVKWPILPLAGIAAGTVIVITLIVVLARRRRYY